MRRGTYDTEPCADWFGDLIKHNNVASACRHWATREPKAARGLLRAADKQKALAGALLEEMTERGRRLMEPTSPLALSAGLGGDGTPSANEVGAVDSHSVLHRPGPRENTRP
jgi:hypothetical protein